MVCKIGRILQEGVVMRHDLHFFGDSFTAGDELMDWKYVENYPAYTNFWEWARIQNELYERYKHGNKRISDDHPGGVGIDADCGGGRPSLAHLDKKKLSLLRMEERQQSYAGRLGGINHAISGCSMQTIARLVIDHLENTNEKCIVIIQPTSIERWCEFVNNQWIDFNSGHSPTGQTEQYYKFRVANSTFFSNLILWYNCVLTLVAYVRSHRNTADWWLINNGTFNVIQSNIEQEKFSNKMIKNTMEELKEKTINFPHVDDMEHPYFCAGGHVNIEAHEKLAREIEKRLQS